MVRNLINCGNKWKSTVWKKVSMGDMNEDAIPLLLCVNVCYQNSYPIEREWRAWKCCMKFDIGCFQSNTEYKTPNNNKKIKIKSQFISWIGLTVYYHLTAVAPLYYSHLIFICPILHLTHSFAVVPIFLSFMQQKQARYPREMNECRTPFPYPEYFIQTSEL